METIDIFLDKYYQLPEYLQKEVSGFVDTIFLNFKNREKLENEITDDVKKTLLNRELYSKTNPETRLNWSEIKAEILAKYEKI